MTNHNPHLNSKQLHLLKVIYRFRFVTIGLVARYKGISERAVNYAFNVLLEQGYIARRYGKIYKINRTPARYYLAPKGLALLRENPVLNKNVLHARYKDKNLGEPFVEHTLTLFKACMDITTAKPGIFTVFTKAELADYDYFPSTMPDLYITRQEPSDNQPDDYLLDIFEDTTPPFLIKKRVDQYVEHYEDGKWIDKEHPTVILVCPTSNVEKNIKQHIKDQQENHYLTSEDLSLVAITPSQMLDII